MRKKGQVILFVFLILFIGAIICGGLAIILQAEADNLSFQKEGLMSFYIADSGVAYAKARLAANESWTGGSLSYGGGTASISISDVSCPQGNYRTCKKIVSTGSYGKSQRGIRVDISLDKPPVNPNQRGNEEQIPDTWSCL